MNDTGDDPIAWQLAWAAMTTDERRQYEARRKRERRAEKRSVRSSWSFGIDYTVEWDAQTLSAFKATIDETASTFAKFATLTVPPMQWSIETYEWPRIVNNRRRARRLRRREARNGGGDT